MNIDTQKKVIVYGLSKPKLVEAVYRLAQEKNWQVIHWFGSLKEQQRFIHDYYPDAHYHCKKDVIKRKLPTTIPSKSWPIRDVEVVRKCAGFEPVLYPVYLREARQKYGMDQFAEYHELITFWYHFFYYTNVDLVIFGNTPAHIYDFLPYLLCQQYKIPKVMLLRHHHIPGIFMPTDNFENPPPRIEHKFHCLMKEGLVTETDLEPRWKTIYESMSGSYESAMYKGFRERYSIDHNKDLLVLHDTIFKKLFDLIRGKKSLFYKRAFFRELLTLHRRLILRWSYNSKTTIPEFDKPYVFVPLHVQPERTSIPQGDIFGHQLLMIDIVARNLPDNWMIYIKEHPVQLYDRPVYKLFRTPELYKQFLRYKNVRLVPAKITSRKMIDHAKAVVAVTSTSCWEALFRGVPSIIFGHVWFSFCQGIFNVNDQDSFNEAINVIREGCIVDKSALITALYAMQEESIPAPPSASKYAKFDNAAEWKSWTERISAQISATGNVKKDDVLC